MFSNVFKRNKISSSFYKMTFKPLKDATPSSTVDRLNTKAKNVGASTDQIQNYEKHILNKKNEKYLNVETELGQDIEKMFDEIESTNSDYLKVDNTSQDANVKVQELSFNDYMYYSDKFINALKIGLEDLIKYDRDIVIEKDPRNFHVKINVKKVGIYVVAKEMETRQIGLTSPISGLFKYKYDPVSRYWISTKDSHILDELLIREFCHHSKGLLEIKY